MALIHDGLTGWKLNRINCGAPYSVDIVGPYKLPQVCDARGTVAVSGPGGAVFCHTLEQAEELCRMANDGDLEVV
jgi:hypothetical protein